MVLMGVFVVAAGVDLAVVLSGAGSSAGFVAVVLIWVVAVLGLGGLLVLLFLLPGRRVPPLVVDADGVWHRAFRLRMAWPNVAAVRIVPMAGPDGEPIPVLMFLAVDAGEVLREAGWWGRMAARSNMRHFEGPLWISCGSLTSPPLAEVLVAIEQYTGLPVQRGE